MYDLILKNISRHIQLTPEEIDCFTAILKPRSIRKRQYLSQAGEIFRYECFVNKGCLRTTHRYQYNIGKTAKLLRNNSFMGNSEW